MGVLISRHGTWRQYIALAAALIAALVTYLAVGRTVKPREEEPRVRLVDADASSQAIAVRLERARIASLWLEGRGFECLVPATYGADESARFSALFISRQPSAQRAPAVFSDGPVGALWARLAQSYDGADLERTVTVEAAEPAIVSITRAAKFTPALAA